MKEQHREYKEHKKNKLQSWHLIIIIIILVLIILLMVYTNGSNKKASSEAREAAEEQKFVRTPAVAGLWYPNDKSELQTAVNTYLEKVETPEEKKIDGKIKAIIVPHAGYVYSAQVAASAFKQLSNDYDTVIVIGLSHYYPFSGASIPNYTHLDTPLGEIKLSPKAEDLLKEEGFSVVNQAHEKEHSIEAELPFIQTVLKDTEIIPIVTGSADPTKLANAIIKYLDDRTLIIVSSDLSHYHSYNEALVLDKICTDNIPALNSQEIAKNCEACGLIGILTLMEIAKQKGWKAELVDYKNSGDVTGDKSQGVVGYASIVFYEEQLSREEKEFLLKLARQTAEDYLSKEKTPTVEEKDLTSKLKQMQGCFVTFTKNGQLRGCIGHILPQEELYKCVIDNAVNAAVHDTRFNPVVYDELKDIKIEISILTVPQELKFDSADDLLAKLRPLVDGVVLKRGWNQATYLPQVWEQIPDKKEFLTYLCEKAGLSKNCWQDENLQVLTYQALVFEEE